MKTINCIADIRHFCTVGVSYKKSDAHNRGKFAVCQDQYEALLKHAKHYGITSVFVLSTCNRTEIYGLTDNISNLVNLLCSVTVGKRTEFEALCYNKTGISAVNHLFNVAAGLDSQILGDYEIVGQLKQAVKFAKERGFIDGFLEKLYNTALQASKQVKNGTNLSKGSTSVSFAAVQLIKQHGLLKADSKILIVGAGKMGRLSCKNLVACPAKQDITVVNRSVNKAREIAAEMNVSHADIADLESLIKVADVIIVATGAAYPVIFKSQFVGTGAKLVIDLALPRNVDQDVAELAHIKLVSIDEVSLVNAETLQKRRADIQAAQTIIHCFVDKFTAWCQLRKGFLLVNSIKGKLNSICVNQALDVAGAGYSIPFEEQQRIQQILNETAAKMKISDKAGCHYLEALNSFMAPLFFTHNAN